MRFSSVLGVTLLLVTVVVVDLAYADNGVGNSLWMQTMCVAVPARTDSTQFVPAANLFVRTQGKFVASEPAWVLIHGTSASENYWRGVANVLARSYHVVSITLRGHYLSQITPATSPSSAAEPFRYTYEVFADDVKAVIDSLGITHPIYYGGLSIGSSIGIQLANKYPGLIERLVLVSGAPLFRCDDLGTNGTSGTCVTSSPGVMYPWLTGVATTGITMYPEDVLSGCNVTAARAKVDQNRAYSGVAVASLVRYAQTTDQTALLPTVKCPTLIAPGLGDITNGVQAADVLHEGIVNSVRADFVNRGHLFPVTAYEDLSEQMLNFVATNQLAEYTRVLDTGCQIATAVAPEVGLDPCPAI